MCHSVRTTMIGMKIGEQLGLSDEQRSALFYTLLLKDLGCSSNASRLSNLFGADDRILKKAHKLIDWTDSRDVARYAMKYTMPGQSRFRRAVHALSLGRKAQDIGHEASPCHLSAAKNLILPHRQGNRALHGRASNDGHFHSLRSG